MGASIYGNVGGVSHKGKELYVKVNGVNRKIKKEYAKVNGVSRCVFRAMPQLITSDLSYQYWQSDGTILSDDNNYVRMYPDTSKNTMTVNYLKSSSYKVYTKAYLHFDRSFNITHIKLHVDVNLYTLSGTLSNKNKAFYARVTSCPNSSQSEALVEIDMYPSITGEKTFSDEEGTSTIPRGYGSINVGQGFLSLTLMQETFSIGTGNVDMYIEVTTEEYGTFRIPIF